MHSYRSIGDTGEETVAQYLERYGCTILARQWHCRYGELDLIAQTRKDVLCFVEVKLRDARTIAPPGAAVDAHKQERLRKTALSYLAEHEELSDLPARFDVAEVYAVADRLEIHYIADAFE